MLKSVERACPISSGTAEFQHRLSRPLRNRIVAGRLLGIVKRRSRIVAPARLDVESMQAKHPGIGAFCHQLKAACGPVAVTTQLRCLGAKEQRKRLVRGKTISLFGEPT